MGMSLENVVRDVCVSWSGMIDNKYVRFLRYRVEYVCYTKGEGHNAGLVSVEAIPGGGGAEGTKSEWAVGANANMYELVNVGDKVYSELMSIGVGFEEADACAGWVIDCVKGMK